MTDLPSLLDALPNRLGTSPVMEGDELVIRLTPRPETCRAGRVRASVALYVVDAVAGVAVDADPDRWTFTSDLRMQLADIPAPEWIEGRAVVLRESGRSATAEVRLSGPDGPVGFATVGFVKIPRREGDPPKPTFDAQEGPQVWTMSAPLEEPVEVAAGITVLDAAAGVVEVVVTPTLRNPSGAMQGAMVSLVAEVAAEEMVAARGGGEVVVVDLEVRYLAQARGGVVRSRGEVVGDGPAAPARVVLEDADTGRLLTLVVARTVPVGAGGR
jgi:acyl-coenzyme A thioesterase PaaI-like protein